MSGTQTQLFQPTDYVDISSVADLKRRACYCHVSQDIVPLYEKWHDPMEQFRGIENHCARAEAFVRLRYDGGDIL